MLPGVLPSISLASSPIALILLVSLSNATTEGSFNTTPFPLIYTKILAVPKSIPISVSDHIRIAPSYFLFHLFVESLQSKRLKMHLIIFLHIQHIIYKNGDFSKLFFCTAIFKKIEFHFFPEFIFFIFSQYVQLNFLVLMVTNITAPLFLKYSASIIFHNSGLPAPQTPEVLPGYNEFSSIIFDAYIS